MLLQVGISINKVCCVLFSHTDIEKKIPIYIFMYIVIGILAMVIVFVILQIILFLYRYKRMSYRTRRTSEDSDETTPLLING